MDFKEQSILASMFLACPCLQSSSNRQQIINNLPPRIRETIRTSATNSSREEMLAILQSCLNFQDGLKKLLEIVDYYDVGTNQFFELTRHRRIIQILVESYLRKTQKELEKYDDPSNSVTLLARLSEGNALGIVPPNLRSHLERMQSILQPTFTSSQNTGNRDIPEVSIEEFVQERRLIFLTGQGGSGKSTSLRWLVNFFGKSWKQRSDFDESQEGYFEGLLIPIYIKLDEWKDNSLSLFEFIQGQLKNYGSNLMAEQLQFLIENYRVLMLLDGLNELPQINRNNRSYQITDLRANKITAIAANISWNKGILSKRRG